MSALFRAKAAISSHLFDVFSIFGMARRISLRVRHSDRHQKIDWHAERTRKFLMQCDRSFTLSRFEIRQIALGNANGFRYRQFGLRHFAPLPQNPNGILSRRQPIEDGLGQHDLLSGRNRIPRLPHDPRCAGIFVGRLRDQSLVFAFRKNGKFLTVRRLDELNLGHLVLSIVNLAAMADCGDDHGVPFDVEDDTPIANAQTRARSPFEPLHITRSRLRKRQKFCIDPPSNISRKAKPLAGGRSRKGDLHHSNIAECNNIVKRNIANHDNEKRP